MTDGKRNIIRQLLQEYGIQSAEDIQDGLKNLLGGTLKKMMETEIEEHLFMENQNVQIRMITVTVIKLGALIAAAWTFKFLRTLSSHLNLRWLKNDRKISPISTRK